MFQKEPKSKPEVVGIFTLQDDGRIWVLTNNAHRPYNATMVSVYGHVVPSDTELFLKELARQTKMSQITYYFIENEDMIEEYKSLLLSTSVDSM